MDSQKQQAAERIKQANNILVTVSNNPSVDQLSACIGLTLALNKMGKHATAVFSGEVPSTIEFLQPEKTIEKNTDSLRDFIIALDKSKADKLRYKVEDRVVKIFITPYRTSINEKDLEFSQGDFNVDVVLALGVHTQAELDQAITSHGRILHDATVISLNVRPGGELGSINWLDPNASSLSELGVQLLDALDKKLVDGQIATAMLTGIVAETERFSNNKTSPQTMSISAELMAEGANQQLVATKLEAPAPPPPAPAPLASQDGKDEKKDVEETAPKPDDGTLEISHDEKPQDEAAPEEKPEEKSEEKPAEEEKQPEEPKAEEPAPEHEEVPEPPKAEEPAHEEAPAPEPPKVEEPEQPATPPQIHIDEHGSLTPLEDLLPPKQPSTPPTISHHNEAPKMMIEPPEIGGSLTAAATPGFGEQEGAGLGMPALETPSTKEPAEPNLTVPNGPVGHTIMPPEHPSDETAEKLDDEAPSGGTPRSDSFLVGNGSMPIITPPHAADQPAMPSLTLPSTTPAVPVVETGLPATNADAGRTLSDIEKDVNSPHLDGPAPDAAAIDAPGPATNDNILPPPSTDGPQIPVIAPTDNAASAGPAPVDTTVTPPTTDANATTDAPSVDSARDAVMQAINGSPAGSLDPVASLNAQPVDLPMGGASAAPAAEPAAQLPNVPVQPWVPPTEEPAPAGPAPASTEFNPAALNIQAEGDDPTAPPPVPPPMMPPANPY